MKTMMVLVLLACRVAYGADSVTRTGPFMNGRGWLSLTPEERLLYLSGTSDTIAFLIIQIHSSSSVVEDGLMFPRTLTVAEIEKALEAYYDEPTNASVPVVMALSYVKLKAEGSSDEKLRAWEILLRSTAFKMLDESKPK